MKAKQKRTASKLIALRLTPGLWIAVKKMAAADGRSASSWVRRTLEAAINSKVA